MGTGAETASVVVLNEITGDTGTLDGLEAGRGGALFVAEINLAETGTEGEIGIGFPLDHGGIKAGAGEIVNEVAAEIRTEIGLGSEINAAEEEVIDGGRIGIGGTAHA